MTPYGEDEEGPDVTGGEVDGCEDPPEDEEPEVGWEPDVCRPDEDREPELFDGSTTAVPVPTPD